MSTRGVVLRETNVAGRREDVSVIGFKPQIVRVLLEFGNSTVI